MNRLLILIISFCWSLAVFAQDTQEIQLIQPIEEPGITTLIERHIELNRMTETVEGWRIQIYATTDRSKLEAARGRFMNRYPQISVDWVHASPWYRLRAGAYANKLEATYALNQLKQYYQEAYLAKDRFKPEELLK